MIKSFTWVALWCSGVVTAFAQTSGPIPAARAVTPVFSQLVSFSYPSGFVPAFEDSKPGGYIQESVLRGETLERWTQMLTLSGVRDLAAHAQMTPSRFAGSMAAGFKNACPQSYAAQGLGEMRVGNHDAFAALIGCGIAPGGTRSEVALVLVVKGERDYYTLQWAERAEPVSSPVALDAAKWSERLQRLMPMKLCPRVPGEAAPYPSCL
ncbi:hypothetical protein [Rhodoferax bucti]|uniref:hypothetical protein n=1 Tax=Rhodoferax bucti TaxID=2576305 RepID=UPI00110928A1|nr:hypothetical protein [Rhodoferax bucti]